MGTWMVGRGIGAARQWLARFATTTLGVSGRCFPLRPGERGEGMKTTDSSTAPDGSAWRPKKLSTREERRLAERRQRRQEPQANQNEVGEPSEKPAQDEPSES